LISQASLPLARLEGLPGMIDRNVALLPCSPTLTGATGYKKY